MLIDNTASKPFEVPDSGIFLGTIIDVVELGQVSTQFGPKTKVRLVWVLGTQDGKGYALDSEGNPFRVIRSVNATMSVNPKTNKKSNLYEIAESVFGTAPPVPFESESLIGRSNQLVVVKEGKFANIKGILPLPAGVKGPAVPQGFIRSKDKPKGVSNGAPAVATAQAPAQQAPVVQVATAAAAPQQPDVQF